MNGDVEARLRYLEWKFGRLMERERVASDGIGAFYQDVMMQRSSILAGIAVDDRDFPPPIECGDCLKFCVRAMDACSNTPIEGATVTIEQVGQDEVLDNVFYYDDGAFAATASSGSSTYADTAAWGASAKRYVTTPTALAGYWTFSSLASGDYSVKVSLPRGTYDGANPVEYKVWDGDPGTGVLRGTYSINQRTAALDSVYHESSLQYPVAFHTLGDATISSGKLSVSVSGSGSDADVLIDSVRIALKTDESFTGTTGSDGFWCVPDTGTGLTSGEVRVYAYACDWTTPRVGATVTIRVGLSTIDSDTTDSNGMVVLSGVPLNTSFELDISAPGNGFLSTSGLTITHSGEYVGRVSFQGCATPRYTWTTYDAASSFLPMETGRQWDITVSATGYLTATERFTYPCLISDQATCHNTVLLFPEEQSVSICGDSYPVCSESSADYVVKDRDGATVGSCSISPPSTQCCQVSIPQPWNGPYTVEVTPTGSNGCWGPRTVSLNCVGRGRNGGSAVVGEPFCLSCSGSETRPCPPSPTEMNGPSASRCMRCGSPCTPLIMPDQLFYSDTCCSGWLDLLPTSLSSGIASYAGCVLCPGLPTVSSGAYSSPCCAQSGTGDVTMVVSALIVCNSVTGFPCECTLGANVTKGALIATANCPGDPLNLIRRFMSEVSCCTSGGVGGVFGAGMLCPGSTPCRYTSSYVGISSTADDVLSCDDARLGIVFSGTHQCGSIPTLWCNQLFGYSQIKPCFVGVPWTLTE